MMRFFKTVMRKETVAAGASQELIEEVQVSVEMAESPVWDTLMRWSVYLIVMLVPFWFLPLTAVPLEVNRLFLVSALSIIGFIAWMGRGIYAGNITFPKSFLALAILVWVGAIFLSSLFSLSPATSFWGDDVTSFFNAAIVALIAFLVMGALQKNHEFAMAYLFLFTSAGIVILFEIFQLVFGLNILPWEFSQGRAFNLVGSWNTLGIFFGFLLVTVAPFLEEARSMRSRLAFGTLAVLAVLFAAIVNFQAVWLGVGLVSLMFLAYGFSRSEKKKFPSALVLLLVSVLLYLSHGQLAILMDKLEVPLDVVPKAGPTLSVAKQVFKENPILGFGPGTFPYAWDMFKDRSFNDGLFWSIRFNSGSSAVTTMAATTGILGILAFFALLAAFLVLGAKVLGKINESSDPVFGLASFSGSVFLLFSWFIYPVTSVITILTFLSIGLFVAYAARIGVLSRSAFPILADSVRGFVSALAIILLMVVGVVGLYVSGEKYLASVFFGRGLDDFNAGSVNTAEQNFAKALAFDSQKDQYSRFLAQVSFAKLQQIVQTAGEDAPDDVRNNFQLSLSNAILNARAAADGNPNNSVNWRLLGQIYEAVIPFVKGSDEAALDAYKKTIALSPQNPAYRDDLARVYVAMGNYVEAKKELEEAVKLKSDFSSAHFRLAQIAALKGDLKEATANTENAALTAPNDIGILFQLGLLYFQQNRLEESRQILERVVSLNTNYSNARYFLGLVYSGQKQTDKAIAEFDKIKELNPGNKEVETILSNLKAGKEPLTNISPPAPAPASRGALPIKDERTGNPQAESSSATNR